MVFLFETNTFDRIHNFIISKISFHEMSHQIFELSYIVAACRQASEILWRITWNKFLKLK